MGGLAGLLASCLPVESCMFLKLMSARKALVVYPETESYTTSAVKKAFKAKLLDWTVHEEREPGAAYDLQLCDYDELDWDVAEKPGCLTNAYMLRKVHC